MPLCLVPLWAPELARAEVDRNAPRRCGRCASRSSPPDIGFVNFGVIDTLDVKAPIRTTGPGARGFNLYDGSLASASFASIETTGDGSIGIQVSKPMGRLAVAGGINANGNGSDAAHVSGEVPGLDAIRLTVADGERLVRMR